MSFRAVNLIPGINTEFTPSLNMAGWSASNLMRFRLGMPEKIGGWQPICQTPVVGTGTGMKSWGASDGTPYLMVGTEQRLAIITGGLLYDITPSRLVHNVAVSFTTNIGSAIVQIIDAASSTTAGDWVYIVVPVSVGGLVLQGFYRITTAVDGNTYQVTAASNATANVVNGGAVPSFTTVNTSATVHVTLNNHGMATGALFPVEVATTVGGLTLSGSYAITSTGANTFDITAAAVATSSATASENGGNARFTYLIPGGVAQNTMLSGWGIGAWGSGPWGMSSGATAVTLMRQWTGDAWGQNLVCCYSGGPIYQWVPPATNLLPFNEVGNPATVLANSPLQNTSLFVHSQAQILVALGCESGGTFDPLLVRWTDQADNTIWVAASGNQAGSRRLQSGSRIVGGMMVPQGGLIWTDTGMWSMQYIGYPEVFGFTLVGRNCGLIAMRALGYLNSTVYWMGRDNFYSAAPGSNAAPMPCAVWDQVFKNLNKNQLEECFCAIDSLFNEVWWFYPSANSNVADSYVKWSDAEKVWDYGSLVRSCWDDGLVLGGPVGCDSLSLVEQHEVAIDGNGAAISYSFTTGYFAISEGEDFTSIGQIWLDFKETTAAVVQVTLKVADFPDQAPRVYGPYSVQQGTKQLINPNARGRLASLTFAGNDVGSFVRLGRVRYSAAPAGRRGGA